MRALWAIGAVSALAAARSACADVVVLSDTQLANVAAGYYSELSLSARDTVIVGDAAAAVVHSSATVAIGGGSQTEAKAVSLINGADSRVASGSNVLDGRSEGLNSDAADTLNQSNAILQEDPVAGHVADFQLQSVNRASRKVETFDEEFAGGIIARDFNFTGSVTTDTTKTDSDNHSSTTSSTSHPTETLHVGLGVALAGEVDVASGAGGITFSDYKTVDTTTTADASFHWSGLLISFTIEKTVTVHSHTEGGVSGDVQLQPFALRAKGVICQTLVGSCEPYVGRFSSTSRSDESTLHPAHIQGASAAQIVFGESGLQRETDRSVALQNNAQAGSRVMNAANVAGTALANGLNVASRTSPSLATGLRQDNSIMQHR